MIDVPMNNKLRLSLNGKTLEELQLILKGLKPDLHNTTDLEERHRLIRAIEIAYSEKDLKTDVQKTIEPERPDIRPFIIGTTFPRTIIRQKVRNRLDARLKSGMIDEVSRLYKECGSWERLERLGLEYRFVSEYLQGKFPSYEMLVEKLSIAIGQFVKRQETWFRGMEKKGIKINWLAHDGTIEDCKIENRMKQALKLLKENDINSINSFDI
jgi:tRNA dimethylallyltransferase